jgi:eukaryotic-like serine/threonine-protein kinase
MGSSERYEVSDDTSPGGGPGGGEFIEREIVGTVLAGRYRIIRKLGEGAMGAVYLGEHLKIGRQDAIKVLRDNLATDAEALARFNRGARNVSAIRHPNVCTIYDYSDTGDGHQFLAMEFIPGETLKDVLDREGVLPLHRAATIARQVADALQAAHDAGVVHRDLKPANIMIVPGRHGTETVRVVDFDLAKGARDGEEAEVTRIGWVVGTPEYMSPEQLTGDRLDGTSDVYSLALVFFRMITGTFPFRASSTHELILQRLTNPPLTLEEVVPDLRFPPGIQASLDRALQRNPVDRYAHAAEFGAELEAAMGSMSNPAPAVVAVESASVPQTRVVSVQRPSSVAADGEKEAVKANPAAAPRRTAPMLAGIAGLVAVGAAAGIGVLVARGGDDAAAGETAGEVVESEEPNIEPPIVIDRSDTDPAPGSGQDQTGGEVDAGRSIPPDAEAAPSGPPSAPPPPIGRLSSEFAGTVLRDQFERLLAPTPPTRAGLVAIRDTAEMIYKLPNLPRSTRAQAASIVGHTYLELGSPADCVHWMSLAIGDDTSNQGYQRRLELCQSRVGGSG